MQQTDAMYGILNYIGQQQMQMRMLARPLTADGLTCGEMSMGVDLAMDSTPDYEIKFGWRDAGHLGVGDLLSVGRERDDGASRFNNYMRVRVQEAGMLVSLFQRFVSLDIALIWKAQNCDPEGVLLPSARVQLEQYDFPRNGPVTAHVKLCLGRSMLVLS